MAKGKSDKAIVGLDIGTTKICTVIAEYTDAGLEVMGVGIAPSKGIRKGVVINIDECVEAINRSVQEAETMAGTDVGSVYVGIAGGHIKSQNSNGLIAIKHKAVTEADMQRAIDAAQAISIPTDREVLHVLPQEFTIDGEGGIRNPVGMAGTRLEVTVHIVSGAVSAVQNVIKCCEKAELAVNDIVIEQLASSEAALSEDEKELGVALIDLGGGTTDIALFHAGSIKYSSVLALGGSHVTNDIAVGLRTSMQEAEQLKLKYGCALKSQVEKDEMIEVPVAGGKRTKLIQRQTLSDIIEPRMEEIFELVNREIVKSDMSKFMTSGVVLTGGGALLPGTIELAENIFGLPVRQGVPTLQGVVDVNNPQFSTAIGLVVYGSRHRAPRHTSGGGKKGGGWDFGDTFSRMKEFLKEFFE